MAPLRALAPLAALFVSALADPKTCNADLPASCQNNTAIEDTCCFVAAGQLVLTQFWDTDPVTGPDDSWTIHGLWPDWCDGSYPSECDSQRAYTNISDILSEASPDTLTYMKKFWKDYQGDDETFWEHEWGKHGTCVSTLAPDCYTDYQPTEEAVAYFEKVVSLFKTLPTYKWLSDAGIEPSSGDQVDTQKVQDALDKQHGAAVQLSCEGDELNQVWYYYNVQGSLQEGKFIAVDSSQDSSCPDQVTYTPKNGGGGNSSRVAPRPRAFIPQLKDNRL